MRIDFADSMFDAAREFVAAPPAEWDRLRAGIAKCWQTMKRADREGVRRHCAA